MLSWSVFRKNFVNQKLLWKLKSTIFIMPRMAAVAVAVALALLSVVKVRVKIFISKGIINFFCGICFEMLTDFVSLGLPCEFTWLWRAVRQLGIDLQRHRWWFHACLQVPIEKNRTQDCARGCRITRWWVTLKILYLTLDNTTIFPQFTATFVLPPRLSPTMGCLILWNTWSSWAGM